jgi:hypothetical protein
MRVSLCEGCSWVELRGAWTGGCEGLVMQVGLHVELGMARGSERM